MWRAERQDVDHVVLRQTGNPKSKPCQKYAASPNPSPPFPVASFLNPTDNMYLESRGRAVAVFQYVLNLERQR